MVTISRIQRKFFPEVKYEKMMWLLELLRTGEVDFDFVSGKQQGRKFVSFIATDIDVFLYNSLGSFGNYKSII